MNIRIDMACNDPDNGVFAGQVCAISLAHDLLELEATAWTITSFRGCPTLKETSGGIRLSGKPWPVVRSKEWIGNWCWNAYWMDEEIAADFAVWLHRRGMFRPDNGEARLFEMWESRMPLDREFVHRQLVKATLAEQRGI